MGLIPMPPDAEVVAKWRAMGENNSHTARYYGVNESTIRKAVSRATGRAPRAYKRLPVRGRALYAEWLKEGADRGASRRLAAKYGVRAASIWMSMRRYLKSEGLY